MKQKPSSAVEQVISHAARPSAPVYTGTNNTESLQEGTVLSLVDTVLCNLLTEVDSSFDEHFASHFKLTDLHGTFVTDSFPSQSSCL